MVKGVIFDVGATLIDFPGIPSLEFETGIDNALSLAANWASLDRLACRRALEQAFLNSPKEGEEFRQINTHRETILRVMTEHGFELSEAQLERLKDVFLLPMLEGAKPVVGMIDVLETLKGQVKLAVASNTRAHKLIIGGLESFGFESFFSPIVTSMSCGYRKPGKPIFEAVLEAWSLLPEQVVMVGDKLSTDILGANSLNIRTVWLNRWNAAVSDKPDATAINAEEILQIITRWR